MCSGGTSLTLSLHSGLHRQLCACLTEASGPLLLQGAKCLRVYAPPPSAGGVTLEDKPSRPAGCAPQLLYTSSLHCLQHLRTHYPHSAYTRIPHIASILTHLPGHALHANDHPHSLTQSYTVLANICIHTPLWTSVMHIT